MKPNGPGLASGAELDTLAELWALSFEEPAPYLRNFLNMMARENFAVVYREEGRVVSGAYLLESTLHIGDKSYSAYYFYAASTHPDRRRKGYMEQVIRFCRNLCEERGIDFLVLSPVSNDLYQYFSRFGFRANFYLKTTQLDREQFLGMVEKLDVPAEAPEKELPGFVPTVIPTVREAALAGGTWLEFDPATLQYMFFEHICKGGKSILLEDGYVLYDLLTDPSGETVLRVRELCGKDSLGKLLRRISEVEADQYVLNLPAYDTLKGGRTSTGRAGMDLAVSKDAVKAERTMKNAYLGLSLG